MILLKTKAKLVAGFDDNQVLQDFSFKIDRSDLSEFNSELSKYLKKFELI
jgi:spore coat protein CotH